MRTMVSMHNTSPRALHNVEPGNVAYGAWGNDTTPVAGTIYLTTLWVPADKDVVSAAILNGATIAGGTTAIIGVWDSIGNLLGSTALAGFAVAGGDAYGGAVFTATIALHVGLYWVGAQFSNATSTFRTIAANTYRCCSTTSQAGAFGTLPAITPVTTFTANVGPFVSLI